MVQGINYKFIKIFHKRGLGEYTITETLKDGWTCTTGNPRTVTVVCDKTTWVMFGNQGPGCLKIYKY